MRHNPVKQKVLSGGRSIGTFVFEFDTTGIGRLAAQAGAEFIVYDMEHTGWSVETIRMLIATTPRDGRGSARAHSRDRIPLHRAGARHGRDGNHGADGGNRRAGQDARGRRPSIRRSAAAERPSASPMTTTPAATSSKRCARPIARRC